MGLGDGQWGGAGDRGRPRVPGHQGTRAAAATAVHQEPVHPVRDGVERSADDGQ